MELNMENMEFLKAMLAEMEEKMVASIEAKVEAKEEGNQSATQYKMNSMIKWSQEETEEAIHSIRTYLEEIIKHQMKHFLSRRRASAGNWPKRLTRHSWTYRQQSRPLVVSVFHLSCTSSKNSVICFVQSMDKLFSMQDTIFFSATLCNLVDSYHNLGGPFLSPSSSTKDNFQLPTEWDRFWKPQLHVTVLEVLSSQKVQ